MSLAEPLGQCFFELRLSIVSRIWVQVSWPPNCCHFNSSWLLQLSFLAMTHSNTDNLYHDCSFTCITKQKLHEITLNLTKQNVWHVYYYRFYSRKKKLWSLPNWVIFMTHNMQNTVPDSFLHICSPCELPKEQVSTVHGKHPGSRSMGWLNAQGPQFLRLWGWICFEIQTFSGFTKVTHIYTIYFIRIPGQCRTGSILLLNISVFLEQRV